MKNIVFAAIALLTSVVIISCTKHKDDPQPTEVGTINLKVDPSFGGEEFELNQFYALNSTDSVSFTTLKFFISNVQLRRKSDGQYYSMPNSYYLHTVGTSTDTMHMDMRTEHNGTFHLTNLPAGEYDQIRFFVGLDSATNHKEVPAANDALSFTTGMHWDWNSGYKFFMLEGNYKTPSKSGALVYHVGEDANRKLVSFPLTAVTVAKATDVNLLLDTDIKDVFTGFDVNTTNNFMMGTNAAKAANNFPSMFTLTKTTAEED